jgi:hypothetical protein
MVSTGSDRVSVSSGGLGFSTVMDVEIPRDRLAVQL